MTRTHISDQETQAYNLREFFRTVTTEEWEEGERWYHDAYLWCLGLAKIHALPVWKVCGVVAALSPRQTWERNKTNAEAVCILWSNRVDLATIHELPIWKQHTAKALGILLLSDDLSGESMIHEVARILNGNKTIAFFENILTPDTSTLVTIDVWMYRILEGVRDSVLDRLADEDYEQMERVIIDMAKQYDVLPSVLQAVAWVSARNRRIGKGRPTFGRVKDEVGYNPYKPL